MSRLLGDDQVARSCVKAQQLMVTGDAARQAAVAKVEELALCPRTYCQR